MSYIERDFDFFVRGAQLIVKPVGFAVDEILQGKASRYATVENQSIEPDPDTHPAILISLTSQNADARQAAISSADQVIMDAFSKTGLVLAKRKELNFPDGNNTSLVYAFDHNHIHRRPSVRSLVETALRQALK